jgi:8-oxo-dGTP pyrophosphatase MutT (NUDIX family)
VTAAVTPRPAATVMLLRDAPTDAGSRHGVTGTGERLEVLLLRRSARTPFVPSAHVFPGGAVEVRDHDPALAAHVDGLDDVTASAELGIHRGGMAFWLAAVRECLEEAGVLLAADEHGRAIADDHPALDGLDRLRRQIESGSHDLGRLCEKHRLRLPLGDVVLVSRWITPAESPRRYDTRFFAAAMPPGQQAVPDRWEAVEAAWWHPADALGAWHAAEMHLIEPTVASLELLTAYESSNAALDALRGDER